MVDQALGSSEVVLRSLGVRRSFGVGLEELPLGSRLLGEVVARNRAGVHLEAVQAVRSRLPELRRGREDPAILRGQAARLEAHQAAATSEGVVLLRVADRIQVEGRLRRVGEVALHSRADLREGRTQGEERRRGAARRRGVGAGKVRLADSSGSSGVLVLVFRGWPCGWPLLVDSGRLSEVLWRSPALADRR